MGEHNCGFTGRKTDEENELMYFRSRMYTAGRFLIRDRISRSTREGPPAFILRGVSYGDSENAYAANFAMKHALDPSGELLTYGFWCGATNSGGGAPIDAIDAACQRHDRCLARWYHCVKWFHCAHKLCQESLDAWNSGCAQSHPNDLKKQRGFLACGSTCLNYSTLRVPQYR